MDIREGQGEMSRTSLRVSGKISEFFPAILVTALSHQYGLIFELLTDLLPYL